MPSIRDVVAAIGQRDGVAAVVLLGRDGLAIDSHTLAGLDSESLAALVPSVVASCNRFGRAASRDGFATGVVEYNDGLVVISQLTADTLLAVVVESGFNVGRLLYELRRHRAAIAHLL